MAQGQGEDSRRAEERKRDRQMVELLNEVRIALPGVQILFGFLLTVPFSQRFANVTSFERNLFYATLLCTSASTICLIAPTATHRLRFHQGERAYVVESANRLLIAGLVFLAVAIVGAIVLVTDYLYGLAGVWPYPAAITVLLLALWFGRPLVRHLRGQSSGP